MRQALSNGMIEIAGMAGLGILVWCFVTGAPFKGLYATNRVVRRAARAIPGATLSKAGRPLRKRVTATWNIVLSGQVPATLTLAVGTDSSPDIYLRAKSQADRRASMVAHFAWNRWPNPPHAHIGYSRSDMRAIVTNMVALSMYPGVSAAYRSTLDYARAAQHLYPGVADTKRILAQASR